MLCISVAAEHYTDASPTREAPSSFEDVSNVSPATGNAVAALQIDLTPPQIDLTAPTFRYSALHKHMPSRETPMTVRHKYMSSPETRMTARNKNMSSR